MNKAFSWIKNNILFLQTLLLLAFIPLYPKLPLVNINHTWVYVRVEDFLILAVIATWVFFLLRKKVTLRTPLTLPIMAFWLLGAISTIHGVVLIFPTISNVFPNVAFFSFMRHIEYLGLFFIAFAGIKDKRVVPAVIAVIVSTLALVTAYGFGQRYLSFPAFLTMNEEYAKGTPIILSSLSRIPSTFAGHYDLAAYLVLVVPILVSLMFAIKNLFVKAVLFTVTIASTLLLFMTVSRVSVFALFIAVLVAIFFQKKKFVLFFVPLLIVLGFVVISLKPTLLARFGNTVKEINVLVDAKSGVAVGQVNFIPVGYLQDKVIKQQKVDRAEEIPLGVNNDQKLNQLYKYSDIAFKLPPNIPLVTAVNVSNGENLPQGTGYINLSLSPVTKRLSSFFYELPSNEKATTSAQVSLVIGDFLVKRASAYDLSFTTRFQGEWPHAIEAFMRNVFFGSGYGSVSLAVDNNYFRMLGETGLLGIIAFFTIFLVFGIYVRKILPGVDSRATKGLVLGFAAGIIGLTLNATLIDVFEASKIAYTLWILMGIVVGVLFMYQKDHAMNIYEELKRAATSSYAIIFYILMVSVVIYSPILANYFSGDDFTWFRWAADCKSAVSNPSACGSVISTIAHYFIDSNGFFYRPGTKAYFLLMYNTFWLNQVVYHAVSIALHILVVALLFLVSRKILKNTFVSAMASLLFLISSGYSEIVVWTAATGHLFSALFVVLSLLLFIFYDERKKIIYFLGSILSIIIALFFYEFAVVAPVLILIYKFATDESFKIKNLYKKLQYSMVFFPVIGYFIVRLMSQSHWFNGDYSYNLLKLPFNIVGNLFGYALIGLLGPLSLPLYNILRNITRGSIVIAGVVFIVLAVAAYFKIKFFRKNIGAEDRRTLFFGFLFFAALLLPFLGLGNITSRYSYLSTYIIILFFVLIVKRLYMYLHSFGKDVALSSVAVILSVFCLFHIIQIQQIFIDWHGAGERTRKFLTSIDNSYADSWSTEGGQLYFVNTPIKNGEAWIFPVGLKDALWFAFKNDKLEIYEVGDAKTALDLAGNRHSARVFIFQDDGSLVEPPRKNLKIR